MLILGSAPSSPPRVKEAVIKSNDDFTKRQSRAGREKVVVGGQVTLRYVHPGTCTYALPTLIAILAGRRNLNHLAAIIIGDAAALEDDDEEETDHQMELYYFFFLVKGWAVQGTMNLTCRSPSRSVCPCCCAVCPDQLRRKERPI